MVKKNAGFWHGFLTARRQCEHVLGPFCAVHMHSSYSQSNETFINLCAFLSGSLACGRLMTC